jgi:hypothetical protein
MNRLSDSIIHCVHSKPNGYQNHQTRRSGHHQEGDRGTPLTVEANGRNNEQVHGGDIWGMIVYEGTPSLAWRATPLDHVFGDTRLRQFKPELEQFPLDAWRSPKRVLDAHPPDQHAQLGLDLWPPSPRARLPSLITAKAGPMPTHEGVGPDDCENL